ncbi:MAG: ferrochelatase [Deltaproteobacteria bacterium]|nr:ferrochelatase [Deltaproteobacteria bacterium]
MTDDPSTEETPGPAGDVRSPFDAVLLIAFGGPESPGEIRPFLERVTAGRRIPPARLEAVARHYEIIGGRSPLNELTRAQADALRRRLARDGAAIPVHVGMRNWRPFLDETLAELAAGGCRRVLGIVLSAFQTEASWDRYIGAVETAREAMTVRAPSVEYAQAWSRHPLFIRAVADRVSATLGGMPEGFRDAPLVFTAHSIPRPMADDSPYAAQFREASRRVARSLGRTRWTLAYQSRSGNPGDPWLEPDVGDVIEELAKAGEKAVTVVPIGFVCDHVEILYDLDVEARQRARELGMDFYRTPAVNDHPLFIDMLAEIVSGSR